MNSSEQLENYLFNEQFTTTTEQTVITERSIKKKKPSKTETSTITTVTMNDDIKLLLYQYLITINSIGQTSQIILEALEQLYCSTIWE
ncbi:unnamed protein product [Rotaria sordida]|uniref:Uncharacterized protein n=1 Tax=Rotaria sordida TaxID=392033 RepID=A0A816AWX3_9BILA|nr:unnamed protein product [Rotaria sordida]CAF1602517.1 unnamed protein product [Rotaria sordida]